MSATSREDGLPSPTPPSIERLIYAGQRLRVDAWTAMVVTALHEAGIRPILLKGPAVAGWLYGEDVTARTYSDIDLLVAPEQCAATRSVLRTLGFVERTMIVGAEPVHARVWALPNQQAIVDLHRVLHGMEHLADQRVWDVVSANTLTCIVRGVPIDIPGPPVRSLHLALHLHVRDQPGSQAWTDLERGVAQVSAEEWGEAAELARSLGVDADMGVRLRTFPAGAALADRLGLPSTGPDGYYAHKAVAEGRATPHVQAVAHLTAQPGWRARTNYLVHKLFPPAAFMRARHPVARYGYVGLPIAYVGRIAWFVVRLPRAVIDWQRLLRSARTR